MKGILLRDPNTGSNMIIDVPAIVPAYSIGTTIIAQIMDDDNYISFEGDIIGIEIQQDLDLKSNIVTTNVGYKVLKEKSKEVYYVHEDEIAEHYPDTNEYDIEYHMKDDKE